MIRLEEIVMIHDLKRQGLSVSTIARQLGIDRKTVRKHLAGGVKAPAYKPRPPRPRELAPYEPYLLERIALYPGLSAKRLFREITAMGFAGGYTTVTDFLRSCRPPRIKPFERRFETPAGRQAQVDFAQFKAEFTDEPGVTRIVWLFSMVLGHSRWLWGRFCATQDLQTVMRCHIDAFDAMGGAPSEVLYDRMKTAVINEDAEGIVIYNRSLVALLDHYGALPRACRPYRAKTKGKIERPYRYIRQDFFLGRSFRNPDDLNRQFRDWLDTVANVRLHATTRRIVSEHFAEEQSALTALFDDAIDGPVDYCVAAVVPGEKTKPEKFVSERECLGLRQIVEAGYLACVVKSAPFAGFTQHGKDAGRRASNPSKRPWL